MRKTLFTLLVVIFFFSFVACNQTKLAKEELTTSMPLITNTNTPAPTVTSTPEPSATSTATATNTSTATLTPSPVYSKLGGNINNHIDRLGWKIVLCDENVTEEDLDNGIILYRIDTQEFFCDFEGFIEPAPTPAPGQYQYFIVFEERFDNPGNYGFAHIGITDIYYPYPSMYNIDPDITAQMKEIHSSAIRIWPLSEEQFYLFFEQN